MNFLCQRFLFERNFSSKKLISVFKRTFFSFSRSCLWVLRIFFKNTPVPSESLPQKRCMGPIHHKSFKTASPHPVRVVPPFPPPHPPPASFSQPHIDFCPGHFSFPYKQQVQFINSTKTCQSAAAPFPPPTPHPRPGG